MKNAIENLKIEPDIVLVDGYKIPNLGFNQRAIIKGDRKSYSIACASILAKVSRDRYIVEISSKYPLYKFEKHKGYGTKEHIEILQKYGPCEIHRISFLKNILSL